MKKILFALTLAASFTACKKDDIRISPRVEVAENYAAMVHASYEDSYNAVLTLQTKINTFTANPTATGLEDCKAAWKAARIPYGQTEAYRFYEGPIDAQEGPEGYINAWPMDESYVDYTVADSTSGIINKPGLFPVINKEVLENANEAGSETNVATGYHAIEFLLWGQDLSASGPGARPYTDYVGSQKSNAARRADYLKTAVSLLAEDLAGLVDAWKPGAEYRVKFTSAAEVDNSITNIIRGIGSLSKGELAGERMAVALTNGDQEDEHSCFSDNTHVDIQMNFVGIENVYKGTYTRTNGTVISGKSLADIIGEEDAAKNQRVLDQLTQTRTDIYAIPAPFDQAILNSKDKVTTGIEDLRKLSDEIADAAFSLGIKVSF